MRVLILFLYNELRAVRCEVLILKRYIHERTKWPDLKIDERLLYATLIKLHRALGSIFGKLDALGFDVQNELLLNTVSDEVVTSSEIEGEILNRSSVRSSVAKRLGLETAGYVDTAADHYTEGVIDMALDATQNYYLPITDERLFGWHTALFPAGRSGIRRITTGAYRTNEISIVSGAISKEKVHYRAPAPERVPEEMKRFIGWLESEQDVDSYVKVAIAHLWFELIHPFDDGNGRIGRAISDIILTRAENSPLRYYSLSSQILKERKAYYDELEAASGYSGDMGRWVVWFLGCLIRAVEESEKKLEKAKHKAMLFEQLRKTEINRRQIIILNKLADGFEGKLTTAKWAKLCKCSHDTALRDIDALIRKGILLRSSEGGRSTSYDLCTKLVH